jgi:MFS family permease
MVVETTPATPQRGLGPEFRKLWAASAASNLGDGVALVAAPLLAASLTRDPALVAGLAFAQRLPWLLFTLFSGALADRLDRRQAMVAVAVCRSVLIGVLGVAILLDALSLPLLYIVFFLLSTGETLFDTSSATVVPALVPKAEMPRAFARLAGTQMVANNFIGPPLGGFLFAVALALPFLVGSGGIAAAAVLIFSLRGSFRAERQEGAAPPTVWKDIADGIRWLWSQPLLRTMALTLAVLNFVLVAQVSIMVLFAQERLGLGPRGFGLLLATHAVGAVLGSMFAGRVIDTFGSSRVLRAGMFIEAGVPAAIALSTGPLLAGTALALFGSHALVWGSLLVALRQEVTPDHLRGRVESAYRFLESGVAAPGALLGGIIAARFGLAAPFWINAVAALLLIPFVWRHFGPDNP